MNWRPGQGEAERRTHERSGARRRYHHGQEPCEERVPVAGPPAQGCQPGQPPSYFHDAQEQETQEEEEQRH